MAARAPMPAPDDHGDGSGVGAMRRVVVRGSSGSGKTTLAAELARRLDAPHVELDAMFLLEGWQQRPDADFRAVAAEVADGDRWVVDGNYRVTMEVLRPRADTLVSLDLPRGLVIRRVLVRTIGRGLLRRELWNGNRERPSNLVRWDPSATSSAGHGPRTPAAMRKPSRPATIRTGPTRPWC